MKLFFEFDLNEDYKRVKLLQTILSFLTLAILIITRSVERELIEFSFILEFAILLAAFRFYLKSQKDRNYAFWGISFFLFLYFFKTVLRYTFVNYHLGVLYLSFLSLIILFIICYIMSSPLYYPRVQWWEYDFRYRGDLKIKLKIDGSFFNARLTDLRRGSACVESFENIALGTCISIELQMDDSFFELEGVVKTSKEIIQGRPIRYGVEFFVRDATEKKQYQELRKVWKDNNKVKLRRKFKDLKGDKELE